jgi:hypothetical protein
VLLSTYYFDYLYVKVLPEAHSNGPFPNNHSDPATTRKNNSFEMDQLAWLFLNPFYNDDIVHLNRRGIRTLPKDIKSITYINNIVVYSSQFFQILLMKRKVDSSCEHAEREKTEECSRYSNWFHEMSRHGYFV